MPRTTPFVVLPVAAALAVACGDAGSNRSRPDVPAPRPVVTYLPPPGEGPLAAPNEQVPVDSDGLAHLRIRFADPPVELLPDTPADPVTTLALSATARSEARGLVGAGARSAQLQEGERARWVASVGAGECVTVLAHGGLGINEIDAFLLSPGGDTPLVLAEDTRNGPLGVVGGQRGCVVLPAGQTTVEVAVLSRRGQGSVLVELFTLRKSEGG